VDRAGSEPVARLRALCGDYLAFAAEQPQRYMILLGGLWDTRRAVALDAVAAAEIGELGLASLQLLAEVLRACVEEGSSSSDDPDADAVVLWVGLHGLAHQRIVSVAMDWPADVEERLVARLARLARG
jgi:hypothetical protein